MPCIDVIMYCVCKYGRQKVTLGVFIFCIFGLFSIDFFSSGNTLCCDMYGCVTYVSTQTGQTIFHFLRISRNFNFEHQSKKCCADRCCCCVRSLCSHTAATPICIHTHRRKKKKRYQTRHARESSLILPFNFANRMYVSAHDVTQNPKSI